MSALPRLCFVVGALKQSARRLTGKGNFGFPCVKRFVVLIPGISVRFLIKAYALKIFSLRKMAQNKRNFASTREFWEQQASTANVLPSPSPSKKFARAPRTPLFDENIQAGEDGSSERLPDAVLTVTSVETITKTMITVNTPEPSEPHSASQEARFRFFHPEPISPVESQQEQSVQDLSHMYSPEKQPIMPEITDDESVEGDVEEAFSPEESSILAEDDASMEETGSPVSQISLRSTRSNLVAMESPEKQVDESMKMSSSNNSAPKRQSSAVVQETPLSTVSSDESGRRPVVVRTANRSPVKKAVESVPVRPLVFEETEREAEKDAALDPAVMLIQKEINDLEAEADYQQTVVTQIRRTVTVSERSSSSFMVQPRAEAERTVIVAGRKRQGCVAQAKRLKLLLAEFQQQRTSKLVQLQDPAYSARVTFQKIELLVPPDFIEDLKTDISAEFFVVIVFMLYEQVYATEVLRLDEFTRNGSLLITNMIQFQDVQHSFLIDVESFLIRIGRVAHQSEESKGSAHTPGFLKRLMAVLPKSGSKTSGESSSNSAPHFRPGDQTNVMSLGSTVLSLDNYLELRHILVDGLVVHQHEVVLCTDIRLDLEVTVPFSGFLTFHCFPDTGTDWIRRWCVLEGSVIFFWRYPDDVDRNVTPLARFDLQNCISSSLTKISAQECARPWSFLVKTNRKIFGKVSASQEEEAEQTKSFEYYVAADGKDAMASWMDKLNTVLTALHSWNLAVNGRANP